MKTKTSICITFGVFTVFLILAACITASALTLDQAIELAQQNLPSYKAAELQIRAKEELYKATFGDYIPRLDVSSNHRKYFNSGNDYTTRSYDAALSYTLFDGGKRDAARNISRLNLDIQRFELKKSYIDLSYNVKTIFFMALAKNESVQQRIVQLQDAQKDYEVAEGRYKFGVAKLSDALQASVRLEQARFNLVEAENNLRKAVVQLNSIIGRTLDTPYDLVGSLSESYPDENRTALEQSALQKPEIKQAEQKQSIAEFNKQNELSIFYPTFSAEAGYTKTSGGSRSSATISGENKSGLIVAKWNIFELGRYHKVKAARHEIDVSAENLKEVKRQVLLTLGLAFEDYTTAVNNMKVAQQQLKQAQQNYDQAFGEYKVGKADILSLVQAESQLASAREQLINTKLNLVNSRIELEKVSGTELSWR
ncbi:MAG: TolC family protein [Dissulfurispiraceae bacterium]|jgi:outer membrane protein TolC|nr:TolC family protein [Dissulfurispiraceae bacterium]